MIVCYCNYNYRYNLTLFFLSPQISEQPAATPDLTENGFVLLHINFSFWRQMTCQRREEAKGEIPPSNVKQFWCRKNSIYFSLKICNFSIFLTVSNSCRKIDKDIPTYLYCTLKYLVHTIYLRSGNGNNKHTYNT